MNKAGLDCSVYSGSRERLAEITAIEDIDVIVCGQHDLAFSLREKASNLKLGTIISKSCLDVDVNT